MVVCASSAEVLRAMRERLSFRIDPSVKTLYLGGAFLMELNVSGERKEVRDFDCVSCLSSNNASRTVVCIISDNSDDLLIDNRVGAEGVKYLSEALKQNSTLIRLELHSTQ